MNLSWIDWGIVVAFAIFLLFVATYTSRFTKSVADFLAASRCAGRYILAVAGNAANFGAVSIVAWYEMFYKGGFSPVWWLILTTTTPILIALSGWMIYRFRETRALTLQQFFEVRYDKRFRIFAGMLVFASGVLNFGIFPLVGGRFFIYFFNLPDNKLTLAIIMAILLGISLYVTLIGGQITVMVSEFVQGTFTNVVFIIIIIYLACIFDWSHIKSTLLAAPADASLINPFRSSGVKDFNMWYFMVVIFDNIYNYISWQGSSGYRCSGLNATEQKMGQALNGLRSFTQLVLCVFIALAMYAVMHHADYASQAAKVDGAVAHITNSDIRTQMLVPAGLSIFLVKGLLGCMAAIMLSGFVSTHSTYMHSWGTIFIQDVIVPLRKKPLNPQQHLKLLKFSIFGVVLFIFVWSLVFPLKEAIMMYFAITAGIYCGGAGAVILGGLYWKRGTTTAAWWTLIIGAILSVGGIVIRQVWEYLPTYWPWFAKLWDHYPKECPMTSQTMYFIAMITSLLLYVFISLFGKKQSFDLDAMLHRKDKDYVAKPKTEKKGFIGTIIERLGFDSSLSKADKWTYGACFGWSFVWLAVFFVGLIYNTVTGGNISNQAWIKFWYIWLIVSFLASVGVTIWLTVGGIIDTKDLFRRLKTVKRDDRDDGTVVGHHNLDEQ